MCSDSFWLFCEIFLRVGRIQRNIILCSYVLVLKCPIFVFDLKTYIFSADFNKSPKVTSRYYSNGPKIKMNIHVRPCIFTFNRGKVGDKVHRIRLIFCFIIWSLLHVSIPLDHLQEETIIEKTICIVGHTLQYICHCYKMI